MKPDYNLCDVCGAKVNKDRPVCLFLDRVCNAAGSMEDECCNFDLCAVCLSNFICYVDSGNKDFELGSKLVKWVNKFSKNRERS